jgi:hypothetical protein
MGRRKNPHYVSYEEAKEIVQIEQIRSRNRYWKYWDMWQPVVLPRNPHRVFADFSWNDFLGNNNKFKNAKPRKYRPFGEALAYARTTNITTSTQWRKTKHPNDIPVRVDTVKAYKHRFKGWKHFLQTGAKKAANVVNASKMIERIQVLAFLHQRGSPLNVFFINIFPGTASIKDFCKKCNMTVVRAFKCPPGYDWKSVIERYGADYGNHEWIINDAQQLFFDIQMSSL